MGKKQGAAQGAERDLCSDHTNGKLRTGTKTQWYTEWFAMLK